MVGQPIDNLQYDNETNATKIISIAQGRYPYQKVINIIIVQKHIILKLRKINLIIIIIYDK